jgi:hypothetical protein
MRALIATRDQILGNLAGRQYGVVAREQLIERGLGRNTIRRSVEAGRLRPLFRGVFAVGHTALPRESWWMAALLACGDRSALSHHAAGAVWGFRHGPILPVHITVTGAKGRARRSIVAHRAELPAGHVMRINNLRVTTPARTIVDLAAALGPLAISDTVER